MRTLRSPIAALLVAGTAFAVAAGFTSADLSKLREIGEVQVSPDSKSIVYSVIDRAGPGRPNSSLWMLNLENGEARRFGAEQDRGSSPRWSPDDRRVAYIGSYRGQSGLVVVDATGNDGHVLAPVSGTNHSLPSTGERIAWAPDGKRIAFLSAVPGPETEDANGDPMVIERYLYKPTASTGDTRFDDNRRLHLFIADIETRRVRQLTSGTYYEHSLAWSPQGGEILFVSDHESDPDRFFNYDVFAVSAADGTVRQLTKTKSAEYRPRWSPDGRSIAYLATKRPLTSSETTMEDTHVWWMDRNGEKRHEIGDRIDNRQGWPEWSADGRFLYFTVEERGSVHLYRAPVDGGQPELLIGGAGSVGSWSPARDGSIVYAFHTPSDLSELYAWKNGATRKLTDLNRDALAGKTIAPVEAFDFRSFDGLTIEEYLTLPAKLENGHKYPLVVMMHGGPHGQQGDSFNFKAQVYASHGYATLMVNYRGSTGYGQKFADAIFGDQDGGEAKDVLAGADAALARYPWIDSSRMALEGGSYGGQLANWLVTQTTRFKAAIPISGVTNLVTLNYLSYYHDYLAVEFGRFPHENGLIDLLWQRSPMRYVSQVKTPVLLLHGENDNDVPIEEAEQFYIALKDVGVPAEMVRYPREGHGIRETKHVIDSIDRCLGWYERYLR